MMKDKKSKKVYLAATLYAVITGLSFLFGKIALQTTNPIDLLAYRFTASFVVILISVLLKWVNLKYSKESIIKILPLALLYPLLFFGFQTFGLQYASSSEAGILLAVAPVFTMILATYFLKEETTLLQKLSVVLSVVGVIYITLKKGADFELGNLKGIILLVLSALSMSGYSVMARDLTKDFSSIELSYMMNIISFICFNILSLGKHLLSGTLSIYFAPLLSLSFIIAIIYLGVLSSLGTSLLTN